MVIRHGLSLVSIVSLVICSYSFAGGGKYVDRSNVVVELHSDSFVPRAARIVEDICLEHSCNGISTYNYDVIQSDRNGGIGFPGLNNFEQQCGITDGPLFSNPEFKVGNAPLFVTTGDLNNDGVIDIVTVNNNDDFYYDRGKNVSVQLGLGGGTYAQEIQYDIGEYPRAATLGDFDGDGDLDLAVTNRHNLRGNPGTKGISLLLNRGDGTFEGQVYIEGGDHPWWIANGDLDGDGDLDLAVANAAGDNISILINNGDATFADHVLYDTGDGPVSIALGDVDGDGNLDIGTSNFYSDDISILINNGNGTFGTATAYGDALRDPRSIVFGDLDGDNDLDVGVANRFRDVAILKNRGDGTFAPEVLYATGNARYGNAPRSVAFGDMNRDGMPDLVVANSNISIDGFVQLDDDNVTVLLNLGDGTFDDFISFEAGAVPFSVAVDDLDGDGSLDIVAANLLSYSVSILRNLDDKMFITDSVYPTGKQPRSVALGDLDGDGDLDFAVAIEDWQDGNGGVTVFLNNGDGSYNNGMHYNKRTGLDVAIGDFDGDNHLDIATTNYFGVSILHNQGDGTFIDSENYRITGAARSVVTGDFDSDEDLDLAVSSYGSNTISILLNLGNGTFANEVLYEYGESNRHANLAVGDLDGDGDIDLASTTEGDYGIVSVLYNRGDGTFEDHVLFGKGYYSTEVAIGDINNDSMPDLALVHRGLRNDINNVSILYNLGGRNFSDEVSFTAGLSPTAVAISDLDGDGDPDLAVTNDGGANISILRNLGGLNAGDFEPSELYGTGDHPISIAIGDLDGDGDYDLATANYGARFDYVDGSSNVSVLLHMNGPDDDDDGLSNVCDSCPASDLAGTVIIGACDSGVDNELDALGCTMGDTLSTCSLATLFIQDYVDCVSAITSQWFSEGRIQHSQRKQINRCAYQIAGRDDVAVSKTHEAKLRSQR